MQGLSREVIAKQAAAMRPSAPRDPVVFATKTALRSLGRRVLALDAEKSALDGLLSDLVQEVAPGLLELHGIGVDTAAALLVTAGDNPDRLRCEAAWAHLCGVSPIEASSGKVTRLRLNRGGDRQANSALWGVVITRLRSDPRPRPTWPAVSKKADPSPKSSASSNATSPARSTSTFLAPKAARGGRSGPSSRLTPPSGCPDNDLPAGRRSPYPRSHRRPGPLSL